MERLDNDRGRRLINKKKGDLFMNKRLNLFIVILILAIFLFLLYVSLAMAGDRIIRHFDKNGVRTGYSKIEGNRESHFSKDWNREGYSIHRENGRIDPFTRGWNRQGHSDIEDDNQKSDYDGKERE